MERQLKILRRTVVLEAWTIGLVEKQLERLRMHLEQCFKKCLTML
ncbi:MAG: hypothetical protein QXQ57_01935 [Sulfolobales archaeon]